MAFSPSLAVLRRRWPAVDDLFEKATSRCRRKDVARDDILDAAAMYLTACTPPADLRAIPEEPQRDDAGLPMEMVFSDR